jgi:L-arabinose isomerase
MNNRCVATTTENAAKKGICIYEPVRPSPKKTIKVGFIPATLSLYDELDPKIRVSLTEFASQVQDVLNKTSPLKVEFAPVSAHRGEFQKHCNSFEQRGFDLLVLAHFSYSPSGEIIEALVNTQLPILLWPAQQVQKIDAAFDQQTMLLNHAVHGTQDLANMLRRNHKPFGILHEHFRHPEFIPKLTEWAAAAQAIRAMKQSKPLVLGGHFDQMLDLQLDGEDFLTEFGVKGLDVSLDEFATIAENIRIEDIRQKLQEYQTRFDWDSQLDAILRIKAIRHELALRQLLSTKKSKAIGINFKTTCQHPRISDSLHFAAGILMAEGIGYAGEGDWVTAMLQHGLRSIIETTSFSEIFSVGYTDNRLLLLHWGEGNIDMARNKPRVCCSSCKMNDGNAEFAIFNFEFAPSSEATLINLNTSDRSKGQMITVSGSIEPDSLPLLSGPRAIFKPRKTSDVRELLDSYAYSGGSHHLVLVSGNHAGVLGKIAKLARWEYKSY